MARAEIRIEHDGSLEVAGEIGALVGRIGGPEYLPQHLRDRLMACMAGGLLRFATAPAGERPGEVTLVAAPSPLALTLLAELRMRVAP